MTADYDAGIISSWQECAEAVFDFYTPPKMQTIENVAPHWQAMALHLNGQTLIHVTCVFMALFRSEDYQALSARQKILVEWAVLFHDISKVPIHGGHDYVHGVKSAAVAGQALTTLDFPIKPTITDSDIAHWHDLTFNATVYSEAHQETIQDSRKFSEIIEGLHAIHHADAYAIVMAVLLHIAIDTDPRYPILAPISQEDMKKYITRDALPIIRSMILADGSGWELFTEDQSADQKRRANVYRVFAEIEKAIT
ncbi:MAG: hypothetical protein WBC91_13160, partial [Phototrophicaceae bacterium]